MQKKGFIATDASNKDVMGGVMMTKWLNCSHCKIKFHDDDDDDEGDGGKGVLKN